MAYNQEYHQRLKTQAPRLGIWLQLRKLRGVLKAPRASSFRSETWFMTQLVKMEYPECYCTLLSLKVTDFGRKRLLRRLEIVSHTIFRCPAVPSYTCSQSLNWFCTLTFFICIFICIDIFRLLQNLTAIFIRGDFMVFQSEFYQELSIILEKHLPEVKAAHDIYLIITLPSISAGICGGHILRELMCRSMHQIVCYIFQG